MKKMRVYFFLFVAILVAACQNTAQEGSATAVSPSFSPTIPQENSRETAVPPSSTQPPTSPPALTPETQPAPAAFDWDNPQIYRNGLIPGAEDALDLLPTAPVYSMTVSIDPANGLVSGSQVIRYTNNEGVKLDDVYLHLFPNLLGGSISISNLQVDGRPALGQYEEAEDSAMRVPLRAPLAPGEQTFISMDFETAVPQDTGRNYGVFAQVDNVMALAHFYPLVAVYDEEGWHTAPPVEFGDPTFTDVGFYLVTLAAPSEQVVVSSGRVVSETADDTTRHQTIAAGPARDFYLVASPDYVATAVTVGETTVNSYAPSELAEGATQAAAAAAAALRVFGDRLVAYPYTELDIVATPTLALGIEYPGVIAITQREYDPDNPISGSTPNNIYLETTVAHEVGHQWFYNLVGNDQLEEPWLDEALAQYVTGLYFEDNYGRAAAEFYESSWNGRWAGVGNKDIPIGLPVSAYDGAAYSGIVYGRGPLFVQTLAEQLGQSTFDEFLQDYVQQNQWQIASTDAFKRLAEEHCQCDLTPLFDEWVYPH